MMTDEDRLLERRPDGAAASTTGDADAAESDDDGADVDVEDDDPTLDDVDGETVVVPGQRPGPTGLPGDA